MFFPSFSSRSVANLSILATFFAATGLSRAQAPTAVTTGHNDNARTGLNASETRLNTSNVNAARFGKLFECRVDDLIWSQPLYLPGVNVPNQGKRNLVYVTSQRSTIYAFDADKAQTDPVLRRSLIEAPYAYDTDTYQTTNNSTPVIDAATGTIYVTVSKYLGKTGAGQQFWIHALDVATLKDKVPPVQIQGDVPSTGVGAKNGRWAFAAEWQKQRPALLLLNGVIYAAFGGAKDEAVPGATWNGWVFGFNAKTLARLSVKAVSPNANGGGIWQAANGLAADAGGIYATTSNGQGKPDSFSANKGGSDYGNSVVRFTPNLDVASYFTPYNERALELGDLDLGSTGPMLFPGTNLLVTGDKTGRLYVVDRTNMGGFSADYNHIVQDFEAWKGHLHGGLVYWNGPKLGAALYGWSEHDYLKAYKFDSASGHFVQTPASKSNVSAPPGMPGGMLSVSSNGNQSGSGIVWATTSYYGDANKNIFVPGVARAFNADDLSNELWNSEMISSRDSGGRFAKFVPPTIADGKLFVPTFSYKLVVYGLLPAAPLPAAPTNIKASGQLLKVALNWDMTSGATTYTVKRATNSGGPYATIASNLTTNSCVDSDVKAGTAYFYVVSASSAGGEGPQSNSVSATPFAPAPGSVLSIDFNGSASPMSASEVAGLVSAPNWNGAAAKSGQLAALLLNGGAASGANATWSGAAIGATSIAETPGNARLMKGYIYSESGARLTVNIQNLPANFTKSGYDIYLYSDGDSPNATRAAQFSVAGTSVYATDAQNHDFDGRFTLPDVANVGNTIVFAGLQSAGFTLDISPGTATASPPRATLNGLQIVAHQSAPPSHLPDAPSNLVATSGSDQVLLSWKGVNGAVSYNLKRSSDPFAPFITVAQTSASNFVDLGVKNGRTYYYVVTAVNAKGESLPSNRVVATPLNYYAGRVISLNFGGDGTPIMASDESAGQVRRTNWNNVRYVQGGLGSLKDANGNTTSATAVWKGASIGDTPIADAPGNARMMRGYIFGTAQPATVDIYGLPVDFVRNGYDVFVYGDNNNGSSRTARYDLGGQSFSLTDPANTQFTGGFLLSTGGNANYVRFNDLKTTDFKLTTTATGSSDSVLGAPINGLQIVVRNPSPIISSIPTTLSVSVLPIASSVGKAQNFNAVYGDGDGTQSIDAAYLRVASAITNSVALDVLYRGDQNKLYVFDGANWVGGFAPGTNNVIQGPRGAVDCSKTLVTRAGNVLTVSWNLIPGASLSGQRTIFSQVHDSTNQSERWRGFGRWTINSAPSAARAKSASAPES